MRCIVVGLACLAALAACGGDEVASTDRPWPSEAERTMQDDHAPTPFTADQIREACPAGRRSTYRIEMPGRTAFLQVFRFAEVDAEGADVEASMTDPEGKPLGEPTMNRSSWRDLQSHASHPAEATAISEARVDVPAGTYDCLLYRVEVQGEEEGPLLIEAWFAKDLPGPPVRMIRRQGGETRMTMTLIAHELGVR